MTWRAMQSLLVLRDQVNTLAPYRSKVSDGLVGDLAHQAEQSDHNPHYVAGVGAEMVTALDLTHDPAGGFDSYAFAEVLRLNRDDRIKYVISNLHIFSAYAVNGYAAWTWRPYSGTDPHTNHVHVSVLDAVISDTATPWNLEGFADVSEADVITGTVALWKDASERDTPTGRAFGNYVSGAVSLAVKDEFAAVADALAAIKAELDEIKAQLPGSAAPGSSTIPLTLTGTISGSVSGSFTGSGTAQ